MNLKKILASSIGAGLLLAGTASADILEGQVYQVTEGDVYVKMADTTVARVPVETAQFYAHGKLIPWSGLRAGQNVTVDYTPVYGFQKYYYESSDVDEPLVNSINTYLVDIEPTTEEYIQYNGRLYRVMK